MSQSAVSVDSNVKIQCIDKHGNITRTSEIHNKATVNLVDGLLRFLLGDFNRSKYNNDEEYVTNNEADSYIPSEVRIGNVGVKMTDRGSEKPRLSRIEYGQLKKPTFDDYRLQSELLYKEITGQVIGFDSIEMSAFDDPSSSKGLILRLFLPPGRLVGIGVGDERKHFTDDYVGQILKMKYPDKYKSTTDCKGLGWSYYNPFTKEYETMLTELGLHAGDGTLLARVLFDGIVEVDPDTGEIIYDLEGDKSNPVIQSDSSSVIIEWRIGIVSIGQNDQVITGFKPVSTIDASEVKYLIETVHADDVIVPAADLREDE